MVLQPAIEGMLGLEPDAPGRTLKLAPYFPWHWQAAAVKNIRMGDCVVDLQLKRENDRTTYTFTANKPVQLVFQPKFPFGTAIGNVSVNGKPLKAQWIANAEGGALQSGLALRQGTTVLVIEHSGGIGALPLVALPAPGDSSVTARIVAERLHGSGYTLTVEGRPGSVHDIKVFARQKPSSVEGAQWKESGANLLTLRVALPRSEEKKYVTREVRIQL